VASNASAYALTRAENAGIVHTVLRKEKGEAPENYGERLLTLLRENAIDVVVLAGFLTILPENVIRAYDHRILNIRSEPDSVLLRRRLLWTPCARSGT